ncbi:MAG: aspartate aminotransferase family protein [candidate division KSB1 bacterium]|nr:aspartate aminotransferase family protein [candidate division KSB1 bacterium]MDZ7302947.1 aspartate aminotransferase family protein [candidate division KSB1 bacterium]MDZ7312223.1 aspartate aminotransferase family protein [candidate division KSB1 bacterium]
MSSIKKFAYPHGNVLYRKLRYQFPCIVRGEGVYLFDNEDRRYLDASGGAIVVNAGHGNAEIASAIGEQARKLGYVSGLQFTHEPVEELARELCTIAPSGLNKAFFLSGGTEATEAALKLVRQYWVAKGQTAKYKIISRMPSYHGNTLGSMGVSGRQHYRTLFEPLYVDHPKIPPPICYRCAWGKTFPRCDYECAQELELAIQQADPETVAAFIAEPVLGSTGGAMVPPEQYYPRVMEICRKYEVLFIADEILCGMGRTGEWFAISSYGVAPDVLLVGKGLTSGYVALSAMLTREDIVSTIRESGSDFLHAQTFAHHPVACAAGLATIRYLQQNDLLLRCQEMGALLHQKLEALREHPLVGDIRGRGLLAGIEFVRDKTTREPFPRAWRVVELIAATALAHGLVVWTNVGHVDGKDGDLILLAPPFIITAGQIDEIVSIFSRVLDLAAEEVSHKGGWTPA